MFGDPLDHEGSIRKQCGAVSHWVARPGRRRGPGRMTVRWGLSTASRQTPCPHGETNARCKSRPRRPWLHRRHVIPAILPLRPRDVRSPAGKAACTLPRQDDGDDRHVHVDELRDGPRGPGEGQRRRRPDDDRVARHGEAGRRKLQRLNGATVGEGHGDYQSLSHRRNDPASPQLR